MAGEFERSMIAAAGWTEDQVRNAVAPEPAEPQPTPPNDQPPNLLSMLRELGVTPDGVLEASKIMDAPPDTIQQRMKDVERQVLLLQSKAGLLVPALRRAMTGLFGPADAAPGEF